MRAHNAQELEEIRVHVSSIPCLSGEVSDGLNSPFVMKTREIFEAVVKMEEGKIRSPPYEDNQLHGKNPKHPPPPFPGHVLRSAACVFSEVYDDKLLILWILDIPNW